MKCFNCQNEINEGDRFCGNCGSPVENQIESPSQPAFQAQPAEQYAPAFDYSRKRKKLSGVAIMLIIVGAVVLAAIIAAVVIFATSASGKTSSFFDQMYNGIYDGLYDEPMFEDPVDINTEVTEVDGSLVIELSDEEYEAVDVIEVTAFAEHDGEYIALGSDTVYNFDDYGNIVVDWDGSWLSVGGYIVSIYIQEEVYDAENDYWTTYGYIPFEYNGVGAMEMVVCWDAENPDGYIMGYRYSGATELTDLLQFHDTNTVAFISAIFDSELNYANTYMTSDELVYGEMDTEIYYADISDVDICYYYTVTDIYGNEYKTELLYYTAAKQEKLPWY